MFGSNCADRNNIKFCLTIANEDDRVCCAQDVVRILKLELDASSKVCNAMASPTCSPECKICCSKGNTEIHSNAFNEYLEYSTNPPHSRQGSGKTQQENQNRG